jgi:hypothetical protein
MAKKNTLVWFGIAAVLVWYYMKRKQTNKGVNQPGLNSQMQTAIQDAGSMARQMVADVVNNTTFTPSNETSRELYKQDKKECNV